MREPRSLQLCSLVMTSYQWSLLISSVLVTPHSNCRPLLQNGLPGGSDGKESACSAGDLCSIPWNGKIPWRRKWQPAPIFLSGKSQGRRSLVSYSPWGCKELDMTEQLFFLSLYRLAPIPILKEVSLPWVVSVHLVNKSSDSQPWGQGSPSLLHFCLLLF